MKKIFDFVKRNKFLLALLAIVLLGAILRFYNYPLRYGFDIDATRDVILTQYFASSHIFPLVGPISALGSFNFGPWYYYQLILFQSLVPLSYAPWIYVSLTSLLMVVVMYKIGEELLGKEYGLVLALLSTVAPGEIISGTGLSNPDLVSLFASLSLLLFILLIKNEKRIWLSLFLGIAIGIGINCHYQMIYFLVLPVLLLFRKTGKIKVILLAYLGVFLTFIPLLYFNITHDWKTLTGLLDYYIFGKNKVYVPNRWLSYLGDFWPTFWGYMFGFNRLVGGLLMVLSLLVSLWVVIKKKINLSYSLMFLLFVFSFVLLRYFSGERVYYYLIFFHPFLILMTGVLLWQLTRIKILFNKFGTIFLALILTVIIFFGINVDIVHTHSVDSHLDFVNKANYLSEKYSGSKFSFYACDGQYRNVVQGMVFLMGQKNRLGDGIKIGFEDKNCKYPTEKVNKDAIGAINFSSFSDKELNSLGWKKISPSYIYSSLTNY